MPHLDVGMLHALLDGEIPLTELPPLQHHLATCAECRARLEAERTLLDEADGLVEHLQVPEGAPRSPGAGVVRPGSRPPWRALAWAATIVLAAGLGYAGRGMKQTQAAAVPVTQLQLADTSPPPVAPPVVVEQKVAPAAEPRGSAARVAAPPPGRELAKERPDTARSVATFAVVSADSAAVRDRASGTNAAAPAESKPTTGIAINPAPMPMGKLMAAARAPRPNRLDELVAGGLAESRPTKSTADAAAVEISLPEAVGRLGGTLRLIDGLVPLRLEGSGTSVRVVYRIGGGEVVLTQQLVAGKLTWTLLGDPAVPVDTIEALRRRVRE